MKGFIQGAAMGAAGVLMVAAIIYGAALIQAPAKTIAFDMTEYDCSVNGSLVHCQRLYPQPVFSAKNKLSEYGTMPSYT